MLGYALGIASGLNISGEAFKNGSLIVNLSCGKGEVREDNSASTGEVDRVNVYSGSAWSSVRYFSFATEVGRELGLVAEALHPEGWDETGGRLSAQYAAKTYNKIANITT